MKNHFFLIGQGFDVHAFEPGEHVMLCGVRVAHTQGLKAHSDGDVALHALSDALLGALALGDIGEWFPDTDPEFSGADSAELLSKVYAEVIERGYKLGNLDLTLMCERPKITPHKPAMRERVAQLLSADLDQVNIKATTTEKLGFVGRGEGIAASATVLLVKA